MVYQKKRGLYQRQIESRKTSNFMNTLPSPQSELAQDLLKDPYKFDFLGIGQEAQERDIENALVANMKKFLLELGAGFAFVGQQYHLDIGGEDFYTPEYFNYYEKICIKFFLAGNY